MNILKKRASLVVSVVIALIVAGMIYVVVNRAAPTVPVVMATKNIAVGAVITEDDITVKNMPAAAVPATSFSQMNKVVGQTVNGGPILVNDIVRGEHLSSTSSLYTTLKSIAPAGWSAVQLPQGQNQAVGLKGIKRGDSVDIYGETGTAQGVGVSCICQGAIVLYTPPEDAQKNNTPQQYIVAVPAQFAQVIAETVVRNKPISVVLPDRTAQPVQTAPLKTDTQAAHEGGK